jgi:hypothetical protein
MRSSLPIGRIPPKTETETENREPRILIYAGRGENVYLWGSGRLSTSRLLGLRLMPEGKKKGEGERCKNGGVRPALDFWAYWTVRRGVYFSPPTGSEWDGGKRTYLL